MKNEDRSDFHAATVKIENEFASKESVVDGTHWTAAQNRSETSSANKEGSPEEKVKCCKQLIDSHTKTLIKIEKREREETRITSELVSYLSQGLSKVGCDSKALLTIVKREKIEVSFGDESPSEFNRFSNLEVGNFSEEDICEKLSEACEEKPKARLSFSPTSLAYVTVVLKDLFPKNCVRGSQEVELRTDESFPCVYSKGEFKLRERHSEPAVSKSLSSAESKGDEKRLRIKTSEDSEKHVRPYFGEKPFLCPHCPSAFRFKFRLNGHLIAHSGEKLYSCAHCSKKFLRKGFMVEHVARHLTERPHACSQCTKAFKCKSDLKLHSKLHIAEKPYSCPQCSAKFARKGYLRGHLLIHSNEKPYGCDQCPSKFKCKSNLNKHKRAHSGRLDRCAHCLKQFRALRKHLCPLSGILYKLYECAHCVKEFKSKSQLRSHILHVHLEMKRRQKRLKRLKHEGTCSNILYHCAHCSRQYKVKHYLRSHILHSHQGAEKLYKCSRCRYIAYNAGHLKGHLLSNCDERPFACNHCPAKFKRSAHLKRHEMLHTDERPFSCDKCQKAFRRKEYLKNHFCKKRRAYP